VDPLAAIFIPGGLTMAALAFGVPTAAAGYAAWRWRAGRRVARGRCGRCGAAFAPAGERFLATGIGICAPCGHTLRRRLGVLLPALALAACVFAVTSGTAFVASAGRGGPELAWWLDGRWVALLLPSVGVGLLTWGLAAAAKRANRAAARAGRQAGLARAPEAQALEAQALEAQALPGMPNMAPQETAGLRKRPAAASMTSGRS
jgi:hypothetical protein